MAVLNLTIKIFTAVAEFGSQYFGICPFVKMNVPSSQQTLQFEGACLPTKWATRGLSK